jgi:hypothetical protein
VELPDIQVGSLGLVPDPTRVRTLTVTFNNEGIVQSMNGGKQTMGFVHHPNKSASERTGNVTLIW